MVMASSSEQAARFMFVLGDSYMGSCQWMGAIGSQQCTVWFSECLSLNAVDDLICGGRRVSTTLLPPVASTAAILIEANQRNASQE